MKGLLSLWSIPWTFAARHEGVSRRSAPDRRLVARRELDPHQAQGASVGRADLIPAPRNHKYWGWQTTSRLTWRPITTLTSDKTWAELCLTNAAFPCSHASRRAASRPTADVEEAVLVRGIDEEQDGAVTQQPNSRSWSKSPVEGGFMLSSRPNLPEQGDSR